MTMLNCLTIEKEINNRFLATREYLKERGITLVFGRAVTENGHVYIYLENICMYRSLADSEIAELSTYLEEAYMEMEEMIVSLPDSVREEIRRKDYSPFNIAVSRNYLQKKGMEEEKRVVSVA